MHTPFDGFAHTQFSGWATQRSPTRLKPSVQSRQRVVEVCWQLRTPRQAWWARVSSDEHLAHCWSVLTIQPEYSRTQELLMSWQVGLQRTQVVPSAYKLHPQILPATHPPRRVSSKPQWQAVHVVSESQSRQPCRQLPAESGRNRENIITIRNLMWNIIGMVIWKETAEHPLSAPPSIRRMKIRHSSLLMLVVAVTAITCIQQAD